MKTIRINKKVRLTKYDDEVLIQKLNDDGKVEKVWLNKDEVQKIKGVL